MNGLGLNRHGGFRARVLLHRKRMQASSKYIIAPAAYQLFADHCQRRARALKTIHLRLNRKLSVSSPRKSVIHYPPRCRDGLVEALLEQRSGLSKSLVEATQCRPAQIFGILHNQLIRILHNSVS
jgi:hypothetical protein